jgi:hypothetical protein
MYVCAYVSLGGSVRTMQWLRTVVLQCEQPAWMDGLPRRSASDCAMSVCA